MTDSSLLPDSITPIPIAPDSITTADTPADPATYPNTSALIPVALTPRDRARRLVWKIAFATLLLMAIGSATRVMNAGLACPDWPLCYGTLFPGQQMNLQVFLEWFHRLDAAIIGCMTIVLVGYSWWQRRLLPTWLPGAAIVALGLILVQGLLGGLTVTELLRFDIVTAHLGTALLFFCTLLTIGVALLPDQATNPQGINPQGINPQGINPSVTNPTRRLPWFSLAAALLIYGQSLSGALVGSRWALHQCLLVSQLCSVMNTHLIGILPASLATLTVAILAWRSPHPTFRALGQLTSALLLLQIALGFATFRLHLQVELLTVCHQAIGAALLGTLICLTVLGYRDRPSSTTR